MGQAPTHIGYPAIDSLHVYDDYHFIKPVKVARPSSEITVEQAFGITNIPEVASLAQSFMDLSKGGSAKSGQKVAQEYREQISKLEGQLLELKNIVEEEKYRTRRNSPVKAESPLGRSQVRESQSRLREEYFR